MRSPHTTTKSRPCSLQLEKAEVLMCSKEDPVQPNKQLKKGEGTSLVVQWLGVHLPMQGARVRFLLGERWHMRGITKPVCHSY